MCDLKKIKAGNRFSDKGNFSSMNVTKSEICKPNLRFKMQNFEGL